MKTKVAPPRVDRGVDDPGTPCRFELVRDVGAVPRHLPPYERVAVRADRLGVRRHVDPRAVGSHLMVIDVRLRDPLAEHDLRPVIRLHRVLHEGVAVVVVSDVVVIQLRRPDAFVLRPDPAVVPVRHDDVAVRIEARNHDGDGVVQDPQHVFIVTADHLVRNFGGRLTGSDFRRMQPVRLDYDGLTVGDRLLDLRIRRSAGI